MGTKTLRLNYKNQWQEIAEVILWRYRFADLEKDIFRHFVPNGMQVSKCNIECQLGEVRVSIVDNASLTRCLMLGGLEIVVYVDLLLVAENEPNKQVIEEVNAIGNGIADTMDLKISNDLNEEVVTSQLEEDLSDDESNIDSNTSQENSFEDCQFSTDEEYHSAATNVDIDDSDTTNSTEDICEHKSDDKFSDIGSDDMQFQNVLEDVEIESQLVQINKVNAGTWFSKELDGSVILRAGQIFEDVHHFRETLREFIIQEGFDVIRVKNEKARVTVICKEEGCMWRVHASPTGDGNTFKIKTYTAEHNCLRKSRFREATDTWIAKKLKEKFAADPYKPRASIARDLIDMYGISGLKPMKLFRARQKARSMIWGDHAKQYANLRSYGHLVLEHNPGSLFIVTPYERQGFDKPPIFKRLFLMFDGVRKAFLEGCRPYLGVDGCFLKGPYGGMILSAIALDGNNGIVPLAFCIAENESRESWMYFFGMLREAIGDDLQGMPWTIMSDRQKGLVDAVQCIFPSAIQRFCLWHIEANFKLKFRGAELVKRIWAAGKSSNLRTFSENMNWIKEQNSDAYAWLEKIPYSLWSRHAYNPCAKVDHVSNNCAESLNSWLNTGHLRELPVLSLLEAYRMKVMKRFHSRYQRATAWTSKLVPNVLKRLNSEWEMARKFEVFGAGHGEYQCKVCSVLYIVNLKNWTCSCGKWTLSGIPCMHAIACIRTNNEEVENYVHEAFTVASYHRVYKHIIHPQPDVGVLKEPEGEKLQPPPLRRKPGRPRKIRRLHPTEKMGKQRSTTIKCSTCKEIGHNKRSCQRAKVGANQINSTTSTNTSKDVQNAAANLAGRNMESCKPRGRVKDLRPKLEIRSKRKRQQL